jgi:hypothetical protein
MQGCKVQIRNYDGADGIWSDVVVEDFSRGGTLISSSHKYQKGNLVWLMITPDRSSTNLEAFMVGGEVRLEDFQHALEVNQDPDSGSL